MHVFRDVILYATLRGSVGDALIDVWFSLLGLSYSLAHTYKVLKKLFFSCTMDFYIIDTASISRGVRASLWGTGISDAIFIHYKNSNGCYVSHY